MHYSKVQKHVNTIRICYFSPAGEVSEPRPVSVGVHLAYTD